MTRYVIIGGGPAGATAALEIRKLDQSGDILIISDEDYQFYKRSKIINLISASCTEDELFLKGKTVYDENNIKFIKGYIKKVIPEKNQIVLENGTLFNYDYLLIASGGSPIMLPWKGVDLEGIHTLYNLEDAKKVAEQVCDAKRVVIIGGGSIAMKAIQNFKKVGLDISIIEKASHLWPIGFDRKVARILEKKIKENGIKIYLNEEVVEFRGENNKLISVVLKSGRQIVADLAVVTIGMRPNIEFLEDSGIKVDKGVLVDMYMKTNFPNIFAAGDVAQIYDPLYETQTLHPTWGNAKRQGKIAAKNMVVGNVEYKGTIPIQTIKIFGFTAIAVGITHSKKNFDEISLVSFEREMTRKFVLKNNHLIGVLVLGKDINKKALKPILKKAVFDQVILQDLRNLLLEEDINFNVIVDEIC
ncbi:MAG: NAD(P)/FAD-dependent oxidoreductase [Candidatus Heimdallarchaeota archaeon]